MDTKIKNMDFEKNAQGMPYPVDGDEELIQRAMIRLTVRKGSFVLDKELGCQLFKLRGGGAKMDQDALRYIKEALYEMPEIEAVSANCRRDGDGILHIDAVLNLHGQNYTVALAN